MTCCSDTTFGPQMNNLLLALDNAFDTCGRPVCRAFLTAAQAQYVPYDTCCLCSTGEGQAWVAVGRVTPMNQSQQGVVPCITNFAATIQIGVARCAAVVDSQGNAPDPDIIGTQALAALVDRKTMYSAIYDWMTTQNIDIHDVTIGDWVPSVQGGCQVGVIELTFMFTGSCC